MSRSNPLTSMLKNITLIGMAGAGKSVLGKQLAERLHYQFVDIDELIEEQIGLKLQQIIDKFGDEKFLTIEEKAVLDLGSIEHCIISPGGSIVYSKAAMTFLKSISKVILLDASYKNIESRISDLDTRGIVGLKAKGLKKLYEERAPLYKKYADVIVNVSDDLNMDTFLKKIGSNRF